MLPCFICGKDAGTGWIQGFPPAPDSQKLALCKVHDLAENRLKVMESWQNMLQAKIGELTCAQALKSGGTLKLLSLYFVGGGFLSTPGLSLAVLENSTLALTTPEGGKLFFPLHQVRSYALTDITGEPDADLVDSALAEPPKPIRPVACPAPDMVEEPLEESALADEESAENRPLLDGQTLRQYALRLENIAKQTESLSEKKFSRTDTPADLEGEPEA